MDELIKIAAKGLKPLKNGQSYQPKYIRKPLNDKGCFIDGFNKRYSINRNGDVFDEVCNLVEHHKCDKGYYYVLLDDHKFYVHMLVAKYYVKNPNLYKHVQFIDGNKKHLQSSNLHWVRESVEQEIKYRGVKRFGDKYTATFTIQLGSYDTPEEAHEARERIHESLKELPREHPARLRQNDCLSKCKFRSGMD